jgi:hypothetical protein
MSYDDDDNKYSRGHVHVNITFQVSSQDFPEEIAKEIEAFINKSLNKKDFPYGEMFLEDVEVDTSECEYEDWDMEDRINYYEDCRDERRLREE